MAADQGRRQRKTTRDDASWRCFGGALSRNFSISPMVAITLLLALLPGAQAKNPFGSALKAFNHTVDAEKIRDVTWERYLLLLSTPQVPERYIPDLPQAWLLAFQKWGDSVRKYSVRNCGSRYDAVQYEELRLRPDPLSFPGSVFVTSAIKVSRNVTAPIKVEISMKKKVYLWVTVPCVNDFGSCDYDDICNVQDCPLFYDFLGLPCGCPIKEGDYSVRNKEFEVPALLLPDWITSGDYQVTVRARSRGEALFCVHFTLSLK
ncbi:ganglioside GM2 activator-like isoform X1 [Dermacentor variabilis]|uniref:ganglioside GM2 activator-like isoform X1 n=1 Tax=Dermacentor variabilis TaxID=34621 RepID=UPI003F5AF5C5